MPSKVSIRSLIERRLGKFPDFMIYCVLEWIILILLFVAGFLALVSDLFAEFCELRIPCLLCTRIEQVLVHRNPDFYYNNSICEAHKEISSLAYCHVHKKLSDIRSTCEGCLRSFSVEKECSGCDKNKSGTGIAHEEFDGFVEDEHKLRMNRVNKDEIEHLNEKSDIQSCSCCGETLKSEKYKRSLSTNAPSPRAPLFARKYSKLNTVSESESELLEHEVASNEDNRGDTTNVEASTVPLLLDYDDKNVNSSGTPSFGRGNKFFGTDSAHASPRLGSRKLSIDILGFNLDTNDVSSLSSKSLMALYMELEEERSAAAVAANNAMAMITRLQAEKASVQMEALQYRRMMEEQAQYHQEAMRVMRDTLLRRVEDVKALEYELETYREKSGSVKNLGSEICEVEVDEDYHELKSRSFSSFSENSGCSSIIGGDEDENKGTYDRSMEYGDESCSDFERERSFLWSLLIDLEKKINSPLDEGSNTSDHDADRCIGNGNRDGLTREVSLIRERLRAVEAESGFLMHASMTLQRGNEGTRLLNEIPSNPPQRTQGQL